jgi:ribosomal protein S18 acetylase RimI-like enzyme
MNKKHESVPKVVAFRNADAAKLAELFNSFDHGDLWPGGFTGGVPFTAERVLSSFPAGVKNITILISTDKGKFTGICSLHPHGEDAEAAYIGVFGAHPDYVGKGHGKAMILKALQIAADHGFRRVDLNTWAGNMRAVPLYKKSGMFWVPETSVYMQDFVPGILNFPLAREFFKKHDWYSSQVRSLDLVPDEFKVEEMEVFPYEFAEGEDCLKVWVDKHGRSIAGLERILDGKHLKIMCRLKDHKVIAGLEHELLVEIMNETGTTMHGSMFLSGFEGFEVTAHPRESFRVDSGLPLEIETKFKVSPQTEVREVTRKQRTVKVSLVINGELIPFEVGMRILPLLEFKTFPETMTVSPGTAGELRVNVFNNSKERFKGSVFVVDEDNRLSLGKTVIPLDVAPKSHSGFGVGIKVDDAQPTSAIPLELRGRGKVEGEAVEIKEEQLYVKCLRPGAVVASVERSESGKLVVVENEDLVANVQLRGGLLNIAFKNASLEQRNVWIRGGFGIGPPYGFVKPIDYSYEIVRKPESLELVLSGLHPDKPGVKMMRVLTFYGGSSLIKEQVKIVNMNPEVAYDVNVRVGGQSSVRNLFRMFVPLKEVMEHEMIGFPVTESDLPDDPKEYKEPWVCYQDEAQGFCFGMIWSDEKLSKIRFGEQSLVTPEYKLGQVKPGDTASTPDLYYVLEMGNWQNIRRRWQSLVERKIHADMERVESKPLFNVALADTVLYDKAELKTQLEVVNFRNKEASGEVVLTPPKGWKIVPSRIEVKKVTMNNPFAADVSLVPSAQVGLGVHSGTINFFSDKQVARFPLDVCLLSRGAKRPVSISQTREKDKAVFKVSNGLLCFKASAEFAGCLYFLSKDDEVNHLCSAFPHVGTKVFLENYTGGIRALHLGDGFDFAKSKSHMESFEAELVEDGLWKGVKFSYESKQQEQIKGVLGSVSYLTLPLSNVIKIKRRFENPTFASFRLGSCLWISPNVGGNFKKNDVIFPRGGEILQFRRAGEPAVAGVPPEKGWALVANAEQKTGLGVIAGNTDKSLVLSFDIGKTMLELMIVSRAQLQPKQTCELEDYIVLSNDDYENIDKLSRALRKAI